MVNHSYIYIYIYIYIYMRERETRKLGTKRLNQKYQKKFLSEFKEI